MSRHLFRMFIPAACLGLMAAATPAVAAGATSRSPWPTVDARRLSTSRVVERVEIGVLGAAQPTVVKKRTLRRGKVDVGRVFKVAADVVSLQSSTESCYYAKPSWRRYNGFGKLSTKAWYYVEWCGKNGKVTRVLTLFCGGVGAQGFSHARCSIRRGSTGYSRLNISGTWRFPFRIGAYTLLTRTITVSARHYASGRYAGTWRRYQ